MKNLVPLVCFGFLFSACSTTIPVRETEPFNNDGIFNFAQLNSRVRGESVVVSFVSGAEYSATDFHMDPDSATFSDVHTGIRYRVATSEILAVERKDHSSGVVAGGLLGTAAGIGGLATLALVHVPFDKPAPLVLAVATVPLGTIMGAVIGGLQGNTQRFVMPVDRNHHADTTGVQRSAP